MKQIYRGYEIERAETGWNIYLDKKLVASQPSEEFAYKWVDRDKKKRSQ